MNHPLSVFEGYLSMVSRLRPEIWTAKVEGGCIHLRLRSDSSRIFTPVTACYFEDTECFEHRGSFFHDPIARHYSFHWNTMVEIRYAETSCDCGGHQYDRRLREAIVRAVNCLLLESCFSCLRLESDCDGRDVLLTGTA